MGVVGRGRAVLAGAVRIPGHPWLVQAALLGGAGVGEGPGSCGGEMRAALDEFLEGLIWWGPQADVDAEQVDPGVFPRWKGCGGPGR